MVLYRSIYSGILNFMVIPVTNDSKIDFIILRTGAEPPVLKIDHRGIFQLGSVSHRFLRLKLHIL